MIDKNKQKFFLSGNDVDKWFDLERLEFIEQTIEKHLEKPTAKSKGHLKRLRIERTKLRSKYSMDKVEQIEYRK